MNQSCVIKESRPPKTEAHFNDQNVQLKKGLTIPIVMSVVMTSPFSYYQWNEYVHATNSYYSHVIFSNNAPFINRVHSTKIGTNTIASQSGKNVTEAPLWLLQRMEALQQRPPPTLQEVETSFRAAEETRSRYEGRPSSFPNGRKAVAA